MASKFFTKRKVFVHCPHCGGGFDAEASPSISGVTNYDTATCPYCSAVVAVNSC